MKFFQSVPLTAARKRAYGLFSVSLCIVLTSLSAFAGNGGGTNPPARPVARLISTTEMVIGNRARPRYVAATRVKTASPTVETSRPTYATTSARVAANRDEQRVFELINAQRRARGEQPLAWDAGLMEIARLHAQNMARQDFFDHTGRDGRTAAERAAAAGIGGWRALGENIAYNQGFDDPAGFVVERWMTSSKHRDNILNGGFTHTGLGVARAADGRIFFTQVFMTR